MEILHIKDIINNREEEMRQISNINTQLDLLEAVIADVRTSLATLTGIRAMQCAVEDVKIADQMGGLN
jgi:prefoldin subunit 5